MAIEKLGNVNGFVRSSAWLNTKPFEFDGTIKGLTRSAIANGANADDVVSANFGGRSQADIHHYRIVSVPHDDRANGFWVERV